LAEGRALKGEVQESGTEVPVNRKKLVAFLVLASCATLPVAVKPLAAAEQTV
jgi:hypothetical protein